MHELAARQGPEVAAMYAARHAERRFKQVGLATVRVCTSVQQSTACGGRVLHELHAMLQSLPYTTLTALMRTSDSPLSHHYLAQHAQGDYAAAAAVFAANGASGQPQYHELYRSIAAGILTASIGDRTIEGEQVRRCVIDLNSS